MAALVALREDGDDYPPVTPQSIAAARKAAAHERMLVFMQTNGEVFVDEHGETWVKSRTNVGLTQ